MINGKFLAGIARKATGRFLYKKKLPTSFGGARIYVTSRSDIRLLRPGFQWCAADLMMVAGKHINPRDHVWDIGSNLGIFSFCSAWMAGSGGSVHSLEADPYFVEIQNRTTRVLPKEYARVTPLCAAVSNRPSLLELAIPKNGLSRNHLSILGGNAAEEAEAYKQVVTVTADFLLEYWPKPDFVKVDVEGAEVLFLEGAEALLGQVRPTFYIEVNPENERRATEIFQAHNYRFFSLTTTGAERPENGCVFNSIVKPCERI